MTCLRPPHRPRGESWQRGRWATSTSMPGSGPLRDDSQGPGQRSLRDVPLSGWAAAWRSAPSSSTRKPNQGHDPIRKHLAAPNRPNRSAPDMPGERGQRHARSNRYAQPPSLWVSVREPTIGRLLLPNRRPGPITERGQSAIQSQRRIPAESEREINGIRPGMDARILSSSACRAIWQGGSGHVRVGHRPTPAERSLLRRPRMPGRSVFSCWA